MKEQKEHQIKNKILIVDDDASQRSLLQSFLIGQGFDIITASSGEEALQILGHQKVDMVISDVRMPGLSGLETLRLARVNHSTLPILLVTAYADIRDAVGAMRDGAVNYLEKPIDFEEFLSSIRQAIGLTEKLSLQVPEDLPFPPNIVVQSPGIRKVFKEVALVAPSDSRVLITGESGTGKEVVADLIHAWSQRSAESLIKVNCAAIPENLLESELFGHEKGSFTNASSMRIGRFEEASKGTILLDEISEMSQSLQAKLLRVIQDGTFQRVGSNVNHKTSARILAATNRDLEADVKEKKFREDLFFRLNVMEIYLPPLRERQADVIPLANLFASQFSKSKPRFSASVVSALELYDWPGNVRELRNAMERSILMARGDIILLEHLPPRIQKAGVNASSDSSAENSKHNRMEEIERITILNTLRENRFNRTETARVLGISRRTLIYKLQRLKELGFSIEAD